MDLREIAVRVAAVEMKDPAMDALSKRHDAAVTAAWQALGEYKKIFEEMQKNRKLSGEVHDFAKTCVEDANELLEKIRSWGDDFRSVKSMTGEEY